MESSKVTHQPTLTAISEIGKLQINRLIYFFAPEVEDGVNGVLQVRARGIDSHRYWSPPSLQQRLQVIEEGELSMSGVGDGLCTVELPGSSDVVIEHPVLGPHTLRTTGVTFKVFLLCDLAEFNIFVVTGNVL